MIRACERLNAAGGCFAESSLVKMQGRNSEVALSEVKEGDMIESVGANGEAEWTRVLYAYTHKKRGSTVAISWQKKGEHPRTLKLCFSGVNNILC
jgi:hypothetical protein